MGGGAGGRPKAGRPITGRVGSRGVRGSGGQEGLGGAGVYQEKVHQPAERTNTELGRVLGKVPHGVRGLT